MHVQSPARSEGQRGAFAAVEQPRVEACVLVDEERAVLSIGRHDEPQMTAFVVGGGSEVPVALSVPPSGLTFVRKTPTARPARIAAR